MKAIKQHDNINIKNYSMRLYLTDKSNFEFRDYGPKNDFDSDSDYDSSPTTMSYNNTIDHTNKFSLEPINEPIIEEKYPVHDT